MAQDYRHAKKICQDGLPRNRYFILLHSPFKRFIVGDGYLDTLIATLDTSFVRGRALVLLTPKLCVYVCTPMQMPPSPNCVALSAAPWMVDWINEITQVYAKDRLFFLGKPPTLKEHFRRGAFLEYEHHSDAFIQMLDGIAGNVLSDRLRFDLALFRDRQR